MSIVLALITCAIVFVDMSGFWSSYAFDIVFPPYLYILIRGLFRRHERDHRFWGYLTAESTIIVLVGVTFILEISQYLGIYKGGFGFLNPPFKL